MSLIVQKYGGTSVGSPERIRAVAERVGEAQSAGHQVVVVVSAMSGETDRLIKLARQVSPYPSDRELDMLLATGEQASIALLAMALHERGLEAKSFAAHQVRIVTDSVHTRARILHIEDQRIRQELERGRVVIVAGFQGVDENQEITTLGRGGSDTSGVALAAALKAEYCEIFTDVDGVYTADPRIVPEAKKMQSISYDEMLELAGLGAKVLQIRSVEFAMKYGVRVHVRSSMNHEEGTWVLKEDASMEKVMVRGVTSNTNEAKIIIKGVPDKPGLAALIFGEIAKANISVDMIVQNVSEDGKTDITFTVPKTDSHKAMEVINDKIVSEHDVAAVKCDDKIAKLSVVGVGMRSHSGIAAQMFQALAAVGINIMMISTSEIAISCVIDVKFSELGVRVLHETFELGK
ncbi:MAG: aspartate kinase [Candidatus Schekmanbacteria bacterium]|nr:aspartate kinase [Candidatus Schekmanbacteria bacterium]